MLNERKLELADYESEMQDRLKKLVAQHKQQTAERERYAAATVFVKHAYKLAPNRDRKKRENELMDQLHEMQEEYAQRDHQREAEKAEYKAHLERLHQKKYDKITVLQRRLEDEKKKFESQMRKQFETELAMHKGAFESRAQEVSEHEKAQEEMMQNLMKQHRQHIADREKAVEARAEVCVFVCFLSLAHGCCSGRKRVVK